MAKKRKFGLASLVGAILTAVVGLGIVAPRQARAAEWGEFLLFGAIGAAAAGLYDRYEDRRDREKWNREHHAYFRTRDRDASSLYYHHPYEEQR